MSWIKLHRTMLDWEWYDDVNVCRLFIHLLLTVNFEPKKWRGMTIERGQIFTSYSKLSKETNLTSKQVRGAMQKLGKSENVAAKGQAMGLMVTVLDYDRWQTKGTGGADRGQTEGTTRAITKELKNIRKEYMSIFEDFRKAYQGTKRGLDVEFKNFKSKNKDYADVVHLLLPSFNRELMHRKRLEERNEFVPPFANLSTWINQKRWTQEFEQVQDINAPRRIQM